MSSASSQATADVTQVNETGVCEKHFEKKLKTPATV